MVEGLEKVVVTRGNSTESSRQGVMGRRLWMVPSVVVDGN